MSWLLPALEVLQENRPERRFHLAFGSGKGLMSELEAGGVDAVVSSIRLVGPELETVALHKELYVFVAAPTLLAGQPLRTPDQAPGHKLLDTTAGMPLFRYFLDAWPGPETWTFGDAEFLGTIAAMRHRALSGAGVAVLPRYFVGPDLVSGALVEVVPEVSPLSDVFRLIWRKGHPEAKDLEKLGLELGEFELR
jgi:DNA-binding transcriptional LysR family regulator